MYSLALDKFTDIQDVPQWAIFIRSAYPDVNVKEEMLYLVAFIETTCGIDIRNALDEVMNKFELPRNKLLSVATDAALTMMGKYISLIGLLNNDPKIPRFLLHNCIIHHEHLMAKYFKYVEDCFADCEFY